MKQELWRAGLKGTVAGIAFAVATVVTALFSESLVNGIWNFDAGDPLNAGRLNENFNLLNQRITNAQSVPIGTILAWHKSLTGTPGLPTGWVECSGQILVDADSVYNGQTMPDLNSAARFLRGGSTSGTTQTHALQEHSHNFTNGSLSGQSLWYLRQPFGGETGGTGMATVGTGVIAYNTQIGSVLSATVSTETRPDNMSVVWIMKVK